MDWAIVLLGFSASALYWFKPDGNPFGPVPAIFISGFAAGLTLGWMVLTVGLTGRFRKRKLEATNEKADTRGTV